MMGIQVITMDVSLIVKEHSLGLIVHRSILITEQLFAFQSVAMVNDKLMRSVMMGMGLIWMAVMRIVSLNLDMNVQ